MKPPAPRPVSGLSAANEASTARHGGVERVAALAQRLAPASAVSGWPAATTPFMRGSVAAVPLRYGTKIPCVMNRPPAPS